jgi:flagellar biosynthesis/type III secretory pathway chaperone
MQRLLVELEQCLVSEQKALVAGAADDLDRLRVHKTSLLNELNARLLASPAVPSDERSAQRARVEELARLNALNGALVAQQFARTKARADALLGAAEAALYGAGGTLTTATGTRAAAAA